MGYLLRTGVWREYDVVQPRHLYGPEAEERAHHEETYGMLDEFGYKNYILMFNAQKFDAD